MRRILSSIVLPLIVLSLPPLFAYGSISYEPSGSCAGCHADIYSSWKGSRHAASLVNPLFRKSLEEIRQGEPGSGGKCLFCHEPSSTVPEAPLRAKGTPREGVTCDFCHTVYAARISDQFPRFLNRPGTKRGPLEGAKSTHHGAACWPLIQDAKLCAGCHELNNPHNVGILTTGSEWRESVYREEGVQCQNCHFLKPYREVTLLRKKLAADEPPDHGVRGGHVPMFLEEAFRMSGYIVALDDSACVELEILNDMGGHKLPTGMPTHRMILKARLFDERGFILGEREMTFARVLGDQTGAPLDSPEDMFLRATRVLSDNRFAPKEKRKISIAFPLEKERERMFATVSLSYELPSKTNIPGTETIGFKNIIIPHKIWQFPTGRLLALSIIILAALIVYVAFRRAKLL
ncbi:MAG: hypothetical protein GTN70_08130 [Deltaproteobacteria bacterium]|nr:hypothetical protein [Deltaproteobacteria bacterium]NIS77666.1 hypothetical protein [Deltaproteobacteria bacterium]